MTESFIHYIWQCQYFDKFSLQTSSGDPVQVYYPGNRNSDSGPDFLGARLRIGEMEWVGSVEIHIVASSWMHHKHQHDEAYENVILHVVWNNDLDIYRRDGTLLPTVELGERVADGLVEQYKSLMQSTSYIPCSPSLPSVSPLVLTNTLDRMLTTRLHAKAQEVLRLLNRNRGDWQETSYHMLARNFGFKVNTEPFFQLARSLPLKTLMKHADKLLQIEAMLFGVAGFLDETENDDEYYQLLCREYGMLRQKYRLDHKMLNKVQWKFLRLRPANFPTLRIAQFAAFLSSQKNFLAMFLEYPLGQLKICFRNATSSYWQHHYNFSRSSLLKDTALGEGSIDNILINTVIPIYAAHAIFKDDPYFMDKAINMLQQLSSEANKVINHLDAVGLKCKNAFDSQALMELHNNFCSRRRCLDCNIGASLVKPENA